MKDFIEIKGNKAKLIGDFNYQVLQELDLELSFKLAGVEFSPGVLAHRWDGRNRLLSSKLEFSLGLVPRVIEFFQSKDKIISVIDHNVYEKTEPFDISKKLLELKKIPREYQERAANIAIEKKRGIVRIATGGGKTLIAALIVAKVGRDNQAVIYVIGKTLLWQFYELFNSIFPGEIGVIGDSKCEIKRINICSIWTVGQVFGAKNKQSIDDEVNNEKKVSEKFYPQIRKIVSEADVSIMDEVHLGAAETFQKITHHIYSQYTIGLSATPWRDDNATMLVEAIFGKIIVNISASELIDKGYLVKPVIKFVSVPKVRFPGNVKYKEIYKDYVVNNELRNNIVVKGAISLINQGFCTLVLYKEIQHGKILYDKFLEKGIYCHLLSGKDSSDERKAAIDEAMEGKCKLLLASSIFETGVDAPCLSGLILAGGNKATVRTLQKVGRVLRPYQDKEFSAIIDFYDQCRYLKEHSLIRKKTYYGEKGFEVILSKDMKG